MTPHGDETGLLLRTAAGDAGAFEALVRRFETPLFRFLCRVTGSPDHAEEIRSWTFLRVFKKAHQFQGGSVRAWVFRIAWRGALNLRRRESAQRAMAPLDAANGLEESDPAPDVSLGSREESERLRAVLSRMDPHTQALLWLCAAERMPVEEASRVLHRPASTLRYQLSKALERARHELARAGPQIPIPHEPFHELR